jgi:hypothetical protein
MNRTRITPYNTDVGSIVEFIDNDLTPFLGFVVSKDTKGIDVFFSDGQQHKYDWWLLHNAVEAYVLEVS